MDPIPSQREGVPRNFFPQPWEARNLGSAGPLHPATKEASHLQSPVTVTSTGLEAAERPKKLPRKESRKLRRQEKVAAAAAERRQGALQPSPISRPLECLDNRLSD